MLPQRRLGRTGLMVSQLGFGGNGLMRSSGHRDEAVRVIRRALDLGVTYFDAAPAYLDCESYLGEALGERRNHIVLASKSAERSREGALRDLHASLRALRTSYLDLWEIHDLRTMRDLDRILAPDGALEAFEQARRDGLVRFIGITAHHDPTVLTRALALHSFDTCMLPVNPAEPHYRPFLQSALPLLQDNDTAIVAMKSMCGGILSAPEPCIRYALSQPTSCVLVGVDSVEQIEHNVQIASDFVPMGTAEQQALEATCGPHAMRLMYYRKKREMVFSLN